MELYVRKYSEDQTVILSNRGEVLGIFESMADAKDAYLDYLNSIDDVNYEHYTINSAA